MKLLYLLIIQIFISSFPTRSFGQKSTDTTAKAMVPASTVLPMPDMQGPVTFSPVPIKFGNIYVSGVVSGLAQFQNNAAMGDKRQQADLSNGQIFIQKSSGLFQFAIQAGTYSFPDLGVPYLRSTRAVPGFYGVIPQAYLEIAPTDKLSFMVGKLPAFMGVEPTFSYENMNIQRGLLWDQSNSVNKGVQVNYNTGPWTISFSLNDGFYSNKYNWLSGTVTYAVDSTNSFTFIGAGSLSRTNISSIATQLYQNNEQGYDLLYTRVAGAFTIQPYLQYTFVPKAALLNTAQNASTYGAALLVNYTVPHTGFSLPFRLEYIASTGNEAQGAPNLLYGAGSNAWSATVTPTYQFKRFFLRGELSYVKAGNITSGYAFGPLQSNDSQSRALIETGFIF